MSSSNQWITKEYQKLEEIGKLREQNPDENRKLSDDTSIKREKRSIEQNQRLRNKSKHTQ